MKNIKSTNNIRNAITSNKSLTAWAVEIDGEIDTTEIYSTRARARAVRNGFAEFYGDDAIKASVRKVLIVPLRDR